MRYKSFQITEGAVAILEEMSGDNEDIADRIIILPDMAEVSDEVEGNNQAAEADVSQSFPCEVPATMEIHVVLAVPEPNSDNLLIISPTPKRKALNAPKSQANEAPQWKKLIHCLSLVCTKRVSPINLLT
ncbi:hypothetical protein QYM36_016103 [Artemia franciscana]|uniref:Uncharacterized protein n=1 Tax=Artemia franciscana TaxID=6661 RepID=A0AA88H6C6_ARTSF|nr:hypothetical protein QYM36_016103 [Artemia franciscana]